MIIIHFTHHSEVLFFFIFNVYINELIITIKTKYKIIKTKKKA